MPKKKLLESLKEEPLELSFAALEQAGKARDEVALLEGISKQLKVLQEAKGQIEADRLEVAVLEKWEPLELTPQATATFSHLGTSRRRGPGPGGRCARRSIPPDRHPITRR